MKGRRDAAFFALGTLNNAGEGAERYVCRMDKRETSDSMGSKRMAQGQEDGSGEGMKRWFKNVLPRIWRDKQIEVIA